MILDDEHIARRHSIRSGFELVSYRQIAIPLFRVFVRILVLDPKPLPPISEYILSVINKGMGKPSDIAGFLGLDERVVKSQLSKLIASDDVFMGAPQGNLNLRLMLSSKGQETLIKHEEIIPLEQSYFFYIDGLTRRAIHVPRLATRRPSQIDRDQIDELAPFPRRKPSFEEVETELRRFKSKAPDNDPIGKWDLLDIISIDRVENWFRDDAVAMLFKASDGKESQLSFIVDEIPSEEHEIAYSESLRSNHFKPTLPIIVTESGRPFGTIGYQNDISDSRQRLDSAIFAWTQLTDQAGRLDHYNPILVPERTRLRQELRKQEQIIAELEAERDSHPFHPVEAYEHPRYLRKALESAKERLIIISPAIRSGVVNNPFISDLEKLLSAGVKVFIGYDQHDRNHDLAVMNRLNDLAKRYRTFTIPMLGQIDSCLLICDDWLIKTAFNWLSYRGDRLKPFVDERGIYIAEPNEVTAELKRYELQNVPRNQAPNDPRARPDNRNRGKSAR